MSGAIARMPDQDPARTQLTSEQAHASNGDWIQPSILNLQINFDDSVLIDGLYVKSGADVNRIVPLEWLVDMDAMLDALAADPEIQEQSRQIDAEFRVTEMDGLSDSD
jgi:hypothetical protein